MWVSFTEIPCLKKINLDFCRDFITANINNLFQLFSFHFIWFLLKNFVNPVQKQLAKPGYIGAIREDYEIGLIWAIKIKRLTLI